MALTAQQIVTQALQIARLPGFTAQAGQWLNVILAELCQTYDFAVALQTGSIQLSTGGGPPPTAQQGSGPYALPAAYLRMANNEVWYYVNQTPYVMISIDLSEFDALVQQAGISNYPEYFATDISQTPPVMYVWPPSGGSYTLNIRYYSQIADIVTPETSATVPWFPFQNYLITRLAGEMMKLADDDRYKDFLGAGDSGAQGILGRILKLQSDDEGRAKTVKLDRRRFGTSWNRIPNTKLSGW